MAPRKDADVAAANEIYQVAQAEANQKLQALQSEVEDIRQESFAMGAIRALDSVTAYNELMKYVSLYRIKKHKEYRTGGLTWDGFCDALNLERRNVDRILEDISPLMSDFSDKMSMIASIPFNKIRYLGRQISGQLSVIENGVLIYGDEAIPITPENADEIQALIERIDEEAKAAKEDADSNLKAKDRVLEAKEKVIAKQEKELAKLSREAKKKGLTPEEDTYIQRMAVTRDAIDGFLGDLDSEQGAVPHDASPRMIAAYLETVGYLKRVVNLTFENATGMYGEPGEDSATGWVPPPARKERSVSCTECRTLVPMKCVEKCCNTCSPRCKEAVVCLEHEEFTG